MVELELSRLKTIYPLNRLDNSDLTKLQAHIRLLTLHQGRDLFVVGEDPSERYYLLDGALQLVDADESSFESVTPVDGGESLPLPFIAPSMQRCFALEDSQILCINRLRLDEIMAASRSLENQMRTMRIKRPDNKDQTFEEVFNAAPGVCNLSAAARDTAYQCTTPMALEAGDILIEQGDPADYWYMLVEGKCEVWFQRDGNSVKINEYGPGGSIGDDALISNLPRNASVHMTEPGTVLRMDGDDFRRTLKPYLVRSIDYVEARHKVHKGGNWIDVRMPREVHGRRIKGALNIPHPIIRAKLFSGSSEKTYVVVCATLRDSPVIAYTLRKYGFDAYFLVGGFDALPASALIDA